MKQAVEMMNEVEVKESRKSKFMQRVWAKMGKEEKGFTLIELLAVLVIIAIIAVIAIPLIGNIISNSRNGADLATARQVYDASRLYIIGKEDGAFDKAGSISVDQMQDNGYLEKGIALPSTKTTIDPEKSTVNYTSGQLTSVVLNGTTFTAEKVLSQTGTGTGAEAPAEDGK